MIDIKNAALVVIDVQNTFVKDPTRHVVPVIKGLVEAWQKAGLPVVFTRVFHPKGGATEAFTAGYGFPNWGFGEEGPTAIVPELAPMAQTVFKKETYGSLTLELQALIRQQGWTSLFFCGIATNRCVLKTAIDAFDLRLHPYIIQDACAPLGGAEQQQAALQAFDGFVGPENILDSAQVLALISSHASSVSAQE